MCFQCTHGFYVGICQHMSFGLVAKDHGQFTCILHNFFSIHPTGTRLSSRGWSPGASAIRGTSRTKMCQATYVQFDFTGGLTLSLTHCPILPIAHFPLLPPPLHLAQGPLTLIHHFTQPKITYKDLRQSAQTTVHSRSQDLNMCYPEPHIL